jgi:hypothetical protein
LLTLTNNIDELTLVIVLTYNKKLGKDRINKI